MSDLISIQAAIKILRDWGNPNTPFMDREQAMKMAIDALEAQPQWIPCSERLPKHNQKILAYYADIDRIMLISFNSHGITTMTAWMPIPTYGGESDDAD